MPRPRVRPALALCCAGVLCVVALGGCSGSGRPKAKSNHHAAVGTNSSSGTLGTSVTTTTSSPATGSTGAGSTTVPGSPATGVTAPPPASAPGGGASAWSTPVVIDPLATEEYTLTSISCPTTSFCQAVEFGGNAVLYSDGGWSPPVHLGSDTFGEFTAVSCSSPSFCMALTTEGDTYSFDGSVWRGPNTQISRHVAVGFKALSCPADGWCVAIAPGGNGFTYSNGSWDGPYVTGIYGSEIAVSCTAPGSCTATDNNGHVTTLGGNGWLPPDPLGVNGITALSCLSGGFCAATGGTQSLIGDGSQWQVVSTGASLVLDVSCASSAFCLGIGGQTADPSGTFTYAVAFDGQAWSQITGPALGDGVAVSCPSTSFCVAVSRAEASLYQP